MTATFTEPIEVEKEVDEDGLNHAICGRCFPRFLYDGKNVPVTAICGAKVIPIGRPSSRCVVCVDLYSKPCSVCGYQPPAL